tara:strand:- start:2025 stop:3917 length:1893 start_codon:yes stop_codon:yes gene_type:complete
MAEKKFPLKKEIISNETAKKLNEGTFNEIALSEEKFDNDKIKNIYNDLFYQIPKRGKKSHESIIVESLDYRQPWINEDLEATIVSLEHDLLEKNEEFFEKSFPPPIQEHPIFPNGSFLQVGNLSTNEIINPDTAKIWFMQQGFKREVTGPYRGFWLRVLRLALKEEIIDPISGQMISTKDSPNYKLVTTDDINSIDNGEKIENASDLNINPLLGIDQEYLYDEIKLRLYCEGQERFYKYPKESDLYDYMLEGYPETGGYWYLDTTAKCQLMIRTDKDPEVGLQPKYQTIIIQAGEHKNITISRDASLYDNYIEGTDGSMSNDPTVPEFYNKTTKNTTVYHEMPGKLTIYGDFSGKFFPKVRRYKNWGYTSGGNTQRFFPGISKIGDGSGNWTRYSRIKYKLLSPTDWDANGNVSPIFPGWHILSGMIDNDASLAPNQFGILNNIPKRYSNHSNHQMINSFCYGPNSSTACYGALGQNSDLQNILNNPNCPYYKKKTGQHNVYGQPILKVNGKYAVFLQRWREYSWGFPIDWNSFYMIEDGTAEWIKNKNLDNNVHGYTRYSTKYFNWTPDTYGTYVNNPTIYFPGLQGVKVNSNGAEYDLLNGNRTFNNPGNYGSNYKVTNWMADNLKRG